MIKSTPKSWLTRPHPSSGSSGVALILLGAIASGLSYQGRTGEPYSLLNHFVSELGDTRYAARAWAFNAGLLLGGLLLTVFMLGVTARVRGSFRYLFGLAALITGVAGTLVGLLPTRTYSRASSRPP